VVERLAGVVAAVGQRREAGDLLHGLDLRLRQRAALAGRELPVVVRERVERDVRRAGVAQLLEARESPSRLMPADSRQPSAD